MATLEDYLAQLQVDPTQRKQQQLAALLGGLGAGLLSAPGWQRGLANGGLLASQGMGNVGPNMQADALEKVKLRAAAQQMADADQARQKQGLLDQAAQSSMIPGAPAGPAMGPPTAQGEMSTPMAPPSFDYNKYANTVAGIDPMKAIQVRQAMVRESPIDKPKPENYTPDSVARFAATQNFSDLVPIAKPDASPFSKVNPADFTPKSIASFVKSGKFEDLVPIDKNAPKPGDDATPLTPDAIRNAAARYNVDGTLPPMGMGLRASTYRSEILNEAAKQAASSGDDAEAQRIRQIANKANASSLTALTRTADQVGAFEKNFTKNADLALEYSKKVDRTGSPLINSWVQAGKRKVEGDPALSTLDVSIKSAMNEYAKIISGSMGNTPTAEAEIKKVNDMLSSASNHEQVVEVIKFMKRETDNRMKGFAEQKKELTDRMRGKNPEAASGGWSATQVN